MKLPIKQLTQNSQIFVPQTVAEAVLVKDNGQVITLNTLLERKLEQIITPANSGLIAYPQGKSVVLSHSNSISANDTPEPVNIKYDNRGHIIEVEATKKLRVTVNQKGYMEYNGSNDMNLALGDDFGTDDDNTIMLKWNNL